DRRHDHPRGPHVLAAPALAGRPLAGAPPAR
ncbi:MAG: hypothetical protein AVDCRST_MAG08-1256, partial [uncultured Acetobacteraceae bacterium]